MFTNLCRPPVVLLMAARCADGGASRRACDGRVALGACDKWVGGRAARNGGRSCGRARMCAAGRLVQARDLRWPVRHNRPLAVRRGRSVQAGGDQGTRQRAPARRFRGIGAQAERAFSPVNALTARLLSARTPPSRDSVHASTMARVHLRLARGRRKADSEPRAIRRAPEWEHCSVCAASVERAR